MSAVAAVRHDALFVWPELIGLKRRADRNKIGRPATSRANFVGRALAPGRARFAGAI